jgi:hypothetical protein
MDSRCPRKLTNLPKDICLLAVLRLKGIKTANHKLTQEEEERLGGCSYAIAHQSSCYCAFKFYAEYLNTPLSDIEIAHLNSISVDEVADLEKSAISKIKDSELFKELLKVKHNK